MKQNSGLLLKESEISQEKQMNAESKLIGAFGRLISELRYIKTDCERRPHMYGGMDHRTPTEKMEAHKTIDKAKLYRLAMEKLEIVEDEIKKTFQKEMGDKNIVIVKKITKVEKPEEDSDESEEEYR